MVFFAIAGSKHLLGLHGRDWRPRIASRGRSCYRFEAPGDGLLSLGFNQDQIIPWMEEPGRMHSTGSLRVGHD